MEKANVTDRIIVYLSLGLILIFTAAFFFTEKKDFSEQENRRLADMPSLSLAKLRDGSFTEGLKDYATDHFPKRDELLGIHSGALRLSGRKQIAGVYLAKDGSLINAYDAPKNIDMDIEHFNKLALNLTNARLHLMLVPTAVDILSRELPDYAPRDGARQEAAIAEIYGAMDGSVDCIDAATKLKEAYARELIRELAVPEEFSRLYYRTDHHWTTNGAYRGYLAYCEAAGMEAVRPAETQTVTDDFYGTIWSKLGDTYFAPDRILLYSDPAWDVRVEYSDVEGIFDSPYDLSYLDSRDKYSLFLSNQHGMVTLTNEALDGGAIALVKDSYANSMVPFLLSNYHTIYVFDTRYYRGGVSSFINEHDEISDVLILYNMGTLDADAGILGIY